MGRKINIEVYMEKLLKGTLVNLRPIEFTDTTLIVKWRNNPNVQQNFIFRETFTAEMHWHWMDTKVASGEVIQYIIEEASTERPVGSVYYRDIDLTHSHAEYGIFIGEDDARGKGYGSETAHLFTEFGFHTLGLHRISLRVLSGNNQAIRSYENAGFQKEGMARDMVFLDGAFRNVIFMSLLAE